MIGPLRWRRVSGRSLDEVREALLEWPCDVGGAVRHMFPLDAIDQFGSDAVRVLNRGDRFAACIALPAKVVVPCGDPALLAAATLPAKRWRLMVGDGAAVDAALKHAGPAQILHRQRYLIVQPTDVPSPSSVPDPGLRHATQRDLSHLADLAVQLHIDDGFGPDPGRAGHRGYAARLTDAIGRGTVWCIGPPGRPIGKVERAVDSPHLGVQLSGIVLTPARRGEGLGTAMVAAAVRAAQDEPDRVVATVTLHVREDNEPALRAYRAAGFADGESWRLAIRG